MKILATSIAIIVLGSIGFASILLISSITFAHSQSAPNSTFAHSESAPNSPEWSFGGRPVIVEKAGVQFGVSENAKLEPSESSPQFIVIRINSNDSGSYDYWQPLSGISNIKVFDSLEDAKSYDEKQRSK